MLIDNSDSINTPQDFKFLADSLPQLIWVTLPNGKQVYSNQQWCAYTGFTQEQSIEKTWVQVLHPDDCNNALAAWQHSLISGVSCQIEHRFRRSDGAYRWFRGQLIPQKDQEGKIIKWYGTCTDIDDQKRYQEAIHYSDQQIQRARAEAEAQRILLYNLFMQAPALIAAVRGPAYTFELVNTLYQQQLFPGRELMGKPLLEAVPEIRGQPIMDILDKVYQTGEPCNGMEMPIPLDRSGNGQLETIYFNFTYQPMRNAQGDVDGIISFAYDVTAQVEARLRIEESEKHVRTLLESIPQIAWTSTPDGEVNFYNCRWYAYTGLPYEQTKNWGWQEVVHPEDLPASLEAYRLALQSGEVLQMESRFKQYDGTYRWHLSRALPLRNEEGEIRMWVGTATDIHDHKLYAQHLMERETYFRQMNDNAPVMIWITRPDGYCTYLNKPWYAYTGQSEEESLGLGWLSATHPDDIHRAQEVFEAAIRQQKPFHLLYRLRGKDGSYRWFLDKGEPKFDAVGNFEGFVGAVIDVQEQRRAEERLLLSVKAGKVGIWEWDTVNNRATYSDLLQEMFGLGAGSLTEDFEGAYQVYQSVLHPEDRDRVNQHVEKALRNAQEEFYVEFRIVKPSGEVAWIAERGEVLFEENRPVRMHGTCIDITDRKQIEHATQQLTEELAATNEELRAANEEIQAANEELGQSNHQLIRINADLDNFVYTASHDLKSPIANIEGLLKALQRQLSGDILQNQTIRQIYELLYSSVDRFKSTIRDLTDVARVGKEIQDDVASINLAEALEEVRHDLEPQIQEAGAQIVVSLQDNSQVYFSRKNLKSILYNLLSNAIKYRSPDREPKVQISCQEEEEYLVLSVKDNGLGMDMTQEEKIFALFKRLHSHVEGTGIGLYIVKKMLENAKGRIQVESQVGVGATFMVYFKR